MTDDLYKGDETTGLLTHFVGRVNRSFWSTLFAITDGTAAQDFAHNTMLFWQNDVLDILQANYSASGPPTESTVTSFGIGNGWFQTADDPNLVYNEDDDDGDEVKRFHASTNFMRFVNIVSGRATGYDKAVVLDGDGDLGPVDLAGVRAVHAKLGVTTLRDASIWDNMIFEYRGLGWVTRGNPDPKPRAFPVRFLGVDDSDTPSLSYDGGKVGVAGAPAGGALGDFPEDVAALVPEARLVAVTRLWASSATRESFAKNVAQLLKSDPAAAEAVTEALAIQ